MNVMRGLLAACLAFGWVGSAAAYDELPQGLAKLSPANVVDRIRIEDEMLDPYIVVSTKKAWDRGRRIDGGHASDVHLRALVDRDSGAVRWQVWHELSYTGGAREITDVTYLAGGHPRQTDFVLAEQWNDCPSVDALKVHCDRYERFVFEIPGRIVKEIAASYKPGDRSPWRMRFNDKSGRSITGGLAPAEVAGLVQAVEQVRREGASAG